MKPQAFLDLIVPAAQACQRASGIPASFTIAQAVLESSWCRSEIARTACNLFGVKADPAWTGEIEWMDTKEFENGKPVMVPAKWRKYRTWGECLSDRAEFFRKNKRYTKCFLESTGAGWARAVARAGYATDPDYAEKLIAIMDGRNMTRFDILPVVP
jgi:flagellum-specific peptidoglycan hydrolase FlgJ